MDRSEITEGSKFGEWRTVRPGGRTARGDKTWLCRCSCGRESVVRQYSLTRGDSKRCVYCARRRFSNRTHGLSNHQLYFVWCSVIQRCEDPKGKSYKYYGQRGIGVCQSWRENFMAFYSWAVEAGWEPGLQIDRTDNEVGYGPSNCRIVTQSQQQRNRRNSNYVTIDGISRHLKEWAEVTGIAWGTIYARYYGRGERGEWLIRPVEVKHGGKQTA